MTSNDEIAELIKTRSNDRLETLLNENPALASGETAQHVSYLMFAVYCRNKEAVDLIRKHKSSLNIFEASATGQLPLLASLVQNDAGAVNTWSADGFTPLGLACFFGQLEAARYLVNNGANINLASNNNFKVTPLHSACAISHYDLAKLLLSKGADVNAKQLAGVTPLHEAAHNGQTRLVELLLLLGADINAKMETGQTPLFMAEENSFADTAEILKSNGGV